VVLIHIAHPDKQAVHVHVPDPVIKEPEGQA